MHRQLKVATLIAVALAFTACADTVPRGITEPDGLRMANTGLPSLLDELWHKGEAAMVPVYACASDKQKANKDKNWNDALKAAKAGKWDQVLSAANKIIKDTDELIAKPNGGIPSSCDDYDNATELAALRDLMVFSLLAFANQGEYTQGDFTAFVCEAGDDCEKTGPGWKVHVPDGTFDDPQVFFVYPFDGPFPHSGYRQLGKGWNIDNVTGGISNNPFPRYICWEGDVVGDVAVLPTDYDEGDVNPEEVWVVRLRPDGTKDYLPQTPVEFWAFNSCEQYEQQFNLLNSAYKLLAGLPLFPKALDAYQPPKVFGGTDGTTSPHFLEHVPRLQIDDGALDALCEKTYEYSPSTANAACTHLDNAAKSETDDQWNDALDSFINVIKAQAGKNDLSVGEANDLICDATSLKRPTGTHEPPEPWVCPYVSDNS